MANARVVVLGLLALIAVHAALAMDSDGDREVEREEQAAENSAAQGLRGAAPQRSAAAPAAASRMAIMKIIAKSSEFFFHCQITGEEQMVRCKFVRNHKSAATFNLEVGKLGEITFQQMKELLEDSEGIPASRVQIIYEQQTRRSQDLVPADWGLMKPVIGLVKDCKITARATGAVRVDENEEDGAMVPVYSQICVDGLIEPTTRMAEFARDTLPWEINSIAKIECTKPKFAGDTSSGKPIVLYMNRELARAELAQLQSVLLYKKDNLNRMGAAVTPAIRAVLEKMVEQARQAVDEAEGDSGTLGWRTQDDGTMESHGLDLNDPDAFYVIEVQISKVERIRTSVKIGTRFLPFTDLTTISLVSELRSRVKESAVWTSVYGSDDTVTVALAVRDSDQPGYDVMNAPRPTTVLTDAHCVPSGWPSSVITAMPEEEEAADSAFPSVVFPAAGGFPSAFPAANGGGFPSANYGGFPSANDGGFPSANDGGFPSANDGGFPSAF